MITTTTTTTTSDPMFLLIFPHFFNEILSFLFNKELNNISLFNKTNCDVSSHTHNKTYVISNYICFCVFIVTYNKRNPTAGIRISSFRNSNEQEK